MSKITLAEWKEKNFPGKVPSLRTCQNWANEGRIPGAMKMGGLWFVKATEDGGRCERRAEK
ncbi:excisionase [Marinobacter sp. MDS2]|uniref:excisionase n=1 Tax=Marinobacter sp. MDS2 TaxID=3065961 RepID=UPI00273CE760|nr:excisionase [Marinobacter sp. MDS2]MDP4546533.1 excisionase [Marinobacter sp. MDS2]